VGASSGPKRTAQRSWRLGRPRLARWWSGGARAGAHGPGARGRRRAARGASRCGGSGAARSRRGRRRCAGRIQGGLSGRRRALRGRVARGRRRDACGGELLVAQLGWRARRRGSSRPRRRCAGLGPRRQAVRASAWKQAGAVAGAGHGRRGSGAACTSGCRAGRPGRWGERKQASGARTRWLGCGAQVRGSKG
jgi:hypothetical protein